MIEAAVSLGMFGVYARRVALFVALFAALTAAACSRATAETGDQAIADQTSATITVRIVNRSQLDAVIFLVHDGVRERLGAVTAATTSNFPVRTRVIGSSGEFTLLADPVGSRRATSSEALRLAQGTIFTWTLETDFSRGAVMVQ
jgi:hypothetical protein